MQAKRMWTIQSLLICFFWNAVLLAIFYLMADKITEGMQQWTTPFLKAGGGPLPEDARSAFSNLDQFITQTRSYLVPVIFGAGGCATFVLWLFVLFQGRGMANRIEAVSEPKAGRAAPTEEKQADRKAAAAPPPPDASRPSPQPAIQLLSILQREGRLIDFLQEDLGVYDDAQIGAAVRSVHRGCKEALSEYVELKPIFAQTEGEQVSVPSNFDPKSIRLIGNVSGNPPFRGTLRHRGWKAARVRLPQVAVERTADWVLAPAEIEIGTETA